MLELPTHRFEQMTIIRLTCAAVQHPLEVEFWLCPVHGQQEFRIDPAIKSTRPWRDSDAHTDATHTFAPVCFNT